METTKTNNETVIEGAKMSEKWFNETSEAMMNVYNKQLQFTTGLYENFANMFFGNTKSWSERQNFSELFLNSDLAKWPGVSFTGSNGGSNIFLSSFDRIYKQTLEYNRNLLASLNNTMKENQFDWSKINEDYLKSTELQLEISKKMIISLSEMSNKQLDLSIDYNKKVMDEINTQLNALVKQNQKMWTEVYNMQEQQSNVEEKKTKESAKSETKKKWDVPVVE